jgi:hypothetical protein
LGLAIVVTGLVLARAVAAQAVASTNPAVDNVHSEEASEQPADNLLRDPFWPVGYWPATKMRPIVPVATTVSASSQSPVADDLVAKAMAMIRLGGIIKRGSNYFATVNGIMVEKGDAIPVMVDGDTVVFIVRYVDMKRIRIEPVQK